MSDEQGLVLRAIHGSLAAGVLIFFAVTLLLAEVVEPSVPELRWAWLGVTAAAVFGIGFVRGRHPRGAEPHRVRTTGIVIWTLAEASALFGIVCTWITGSIAPALGATLVGLFLMLHHRPSTLE